MRLAGHFITFLKLFNKFNNIGEWMFDSTYYMTLIALLALKVHDIVI